MPYIMPGKAERREKIRQELDRILPIIKQMGVEKVILFGSAARGNTGSHSDIDLIIVKETDKPFIRRPDEFYAAVNPRVALDILVYTPEEFETLKTVNPFIYRAVNEGRIIYEA